MTAVRVLARCAPWPSGTTRITCPGTDAPTCTRVVTLSGTVRVMRSGRVGSIAVAAATRSATMWWVSRSSSRTRWPGPRRRVVTRTLAVSSAPGMPGSTLTATTLSLRRCSSRLAGVLVTPLASSRARECSGSMDTVLADTVLVEAHHAYPPGAIVRHRGGSPFTGGEPPPAPPAHVRRRVGVGGDDDGGEPVDPQPVLGVALAGQHQEPAGLQVPLPVRADLRRDRVHGARRYRRLRLVGHAALPW